MTREAQIDWLCRLRSYLNTGMISTPWNRKFTEALNSVLEILEPTRWISVSERLPERPYGCIVTVMDTNPMTCDEFENIYPGFVGWDGENWNDVNGNSIPFEVIAWQPLPEPYKVESEEKG